MDNAIKFSPEGGEIFIITQLNSGYVEVQILDHGPGMKPEEIDELFNIQAGEASNFTQRTRSSGLGLSMAKRMIELHGGKLWIESDGKNGTKVNFRLPIKE
jgi:signal transduction histidine kinase